MGLPYGNITDMVLSDIQDNLLNRYGLIVWTGQAPTYPVTTRAKLEKFANKGRSVVLFGEAASYMFPDIFGQFMAMSIIGKGTEIDYQGKKIKENSDFGLYHIKVPSYAKVIAKVNNKALIIELPYQQGGSISIVLSPYGLNDEAKTVAPPVYGQTIQFPYTYLEHAKAILHAKSKEQQLFSVGNANLNHLATRKKSGKYILAIFNNDIKHQEFSISSKIGEITNIKEIKLDDLAPLFDDKATRFAYLPRGYWKDEENKEQCFAKLDQFSDQNHIAGFDVRLFELTINESDDVLVQDVVPNKAIHRRFMAVKSLLEINERINRFSNFDELFAGVKISATTFQKIDTNYFRKSIAPWLDRRNVQILLDANNYEEKRLLPLLTTLSIAKARVIVLKDNPSTALQKTCQDLKIELLEERNGQVIRIKHSFSPDEHTTNISKAILIFDLLYDDQDQAFLDIQSVLQAKKGEKIRFIGKALLDDNFNDLATDKAINKNNYFLDLGQHIWSIQDDLADKKEVLPYLEGIKVDASYLAYHSKESLKQQAQWLKAQDLKVIIDFSSEQFYATGIVVCTFYERTFEESLKTLEELFQKMNTLGSKEAILDLSYVWTKKYDELKNYFGDGLSQITSLALQYNINVHTKFSKNIYNDSFPNASSHPNFYILNPDETKMTQAAKKCKVSPYVLYPYKSNIPVYLQNTLAQSTLESKRDLSEKIILNAEYKSVKDILNEIEGLERK